MHLSLIDWLIIGAFIVTSISISLYYRQRASKDISEFFLGGRNLPWYVAGISMVATTFAADTPLAVTELVAKNGISGNWLWWCFLAGGMLTTFFFARLWRRAEVLTEVELIELRYSGIEAAILRGFKSVYLGLFMNCLIIGWVNLALMSLLQVFFGLTNPNVLPENAGVMESFFYYLNDPAFQYTALAMLIAAGYSTLSGLWGVAVTDVVQFCIAMVGTVALAFFVLDAPQVGGIVGLKEQLPSWSLEFFPRIGEGTDGASALTIGIGAFLAYASVQWWASWYPGAEPGGGGYIAQRMMSAKDEKHSIFATLFFQIAHYCLRPWPWIIVGLCTLILYPELGAGDKKLGYVMAMRDFLPNGMKGLLLVAFLAAYMSTISTQLNWGSSYLVNDLYKRFAEPKATQKKLVSVSRLVTLLVSIVGLTITTQINSISEVWSFIIECGAGLGLVLILRWYWWRINAWSEIAATIAPFIAYAVSKWVFELEFPNSFFVTVGFTTVTWLVVTFITKPSTNDVLINFYHKVRPDGAWEPVRQLAGGEAFKSNVPNLIVCWLSAIAFTYSILFLTGKLIFMEWNDALIWAGVALVSFFVLRSFVLKTRIFQ